MQPAWKSVVMGGTYAWLWAMSMAWGGVAAAQASDTPTGAGLTPDRLMQALMSGDPATAVQALDAAVASGDRKLAPPIGSAIEHGLPPQLATRAVDALVALGDARVATALEGLVEHRRANVRARAVRALGQLGARAAQGVMLARLDDASQEVREAAATALGAIQHRRALPRLLAAYARGLRGAAPVIAALARPADVKRMVRACRGRPPEDIVALLVPWLEREDVPERAQLGMLRAMDAALAPEAMQQVLRGTAAQGDDMRPAIRRAVTDEAGAEDAEHKLSRTRIGSEGASPRLLARSAR